MNTLVHKVLLPTALITASVFLGCSISAGQEDRPPELRKVMVGDCVELHYVECGKGAVVLFIHGTLGDYSTWEGQLGPFAETYRAIAYSRRYNYPNTNRQRPNHSAIVEAEDVAAFITKLDLGKVHVVGHSYGAYTALFLAVQHPELIRTKKWVRAGEGDR
jgi:pimeloyl-ACP methyl ester carboxylesterase